MCRLVVISPVKHSRDRLLLCIGSTIMPPLQQCSSQGAFYVIHSLCQLWGTHYINIPYVQERTMMFQSYTIHWNCSTACHWHANTTWNDINILKINQEFLQICISQCLPALIACSDVPNHIVEIMFFTVECLFHYGMPRKEKTTLHSAKWG